jgi:hypothetical protein
MKQDENDQNYKKGPTPVVGKKPNGKSQSICEAIANAVAWLGSDGNCPRSAGKKTTTVGIGLSDA